MAVLAAPCRLLFRILDDRKMTGSTYSCPWLTPRHNAKLVAAHQDEEVAANHSLTGSSHRAVRSVTICFSARNPRQTITVFLISLTLEINKKNPYLLVTLKQVRFDSI